MNENATTVAFRHCYVHVPFCARRCSYCDFAIAVRRNVPVDEYVSALQREWGIRDLSRSTTQLDTVYFGGGTPSLLGAKGIGDLMAWFQSVASISPGAEITLEANPEDITPAAVAAWKVAGINRLSIGVQSFDDHVLQWMHRVHNSAAAQRAAQVARDGGLNAFSIDLIFALPQSLQRNWQRDLDFALQLEPDHISLYGLTIEPRTPLGRWQSRGEVTEAPEETYEEQFLLAHKHFSAAGFEHYEVSNFARANKRAVHNSAYWSGVPYVGIGPAAHGFDGISRRANTSAYSQWRQQISANQDCVAECEILRAENRLMEAVYLGLRTVDGLGVTDADVPLISKWTEAGWLEPLDSAGSLRVRCTPLGWLRLDALARDLTALRSC